MKKTIISAIAVLAISASALQSSAVLAATVTPARSNAGVTLTDGTEGHPTDPEGPHDNGDGDNNGTGNNGPLSIDYVPNLNFGDQVINGKEQTFNAVNDNPYVQVTDNRGTGAGWDLTAKLSNFSDSKDKILPGASIVFKGVVSGKAENVVKNPIVPESVEVKAGEDAASMMSAPADTGRGTWIDQFSGKLNDNSSVQLKMNTAAADVNTSYNATIDWELSDAPK